MSTGVRYFYPAEVFPRYKFFQERLLRLVPRFERLIDVGKLSHYISQGVARFKVIIAAAEEYRKPLSVTVFADDVSQIRALESKLLRTRQPLLEEKWRSPEQITWPLYVKETDKVTDIVVYVIASQEQKILSDVEDKFSSLSGARFGKIIIYNAEAGTSLLYSDLEGADFQINRDSVTKRIESISLQIQHLLESNVVAILERILEYIGEFVPKGCGLEQEQSLLDEINSQVIKCLKDKHVIEDLTPEAQALKTANIDEEQMELDSYPSTSSDDDSITKIKSLQQPLALSDSEKDEKLYRNLVAYISNKTKCIVCDHLSKKLALSPNLVNAFLHDASFEYEKRFDKLMKMVSHPHWSQVEQVTVAKFKYFTNRCITNTSEIIHETENYILEKLKILTVLKHMEFEMLGLLKHAQVKIHTDIPEIPKLDRELQLELLAFPEVTGCGTIYGKLTLHATENLTPSRKADVTGLLQHYKHFDGYVVELVMERKEQTVYIQNGNRLRARLTPEGKQELQAKYPEHNIGEYSRGSLGCFLKKKSVADEDGLYCITCAHCVFHCLETVEANIGGEVYDEIGRSLYQMYAPEIFDIAAIKVNKEKYDLCDITLKKSCGIKCSVVWSLFEGEVNDIIQESVYKNGCESDVTHGVVTSTDYMTQGMKNEIEKSPDINELYNILVDSMPDVPGESVPFSKPGDSGSVVCTVTPDDLAVVVISLLQGCFSANNQKFMYSYSTHLKKNLDVLRINYHCEFEPASGLPLEVGDRVTRGPDWNKGNEDGGENNQGTVKKVSNPGWVEVQWDVKDVLYIRSETSKRFKQATSSEDGTRSGSGNRVDRYRNGAHGKIDLAVVGESTAPVPMETN